eukprot:scaffold281525_cov32-Tisochrysis_lutea.AAC.3
MSVRLDQALQSESMAMSRVADTAKQWQRREGLTGWVPNLRGTAPVGGAASGVGAAPGHVRNGRNRKSDVKISSRA